MRHIRAAALAALSLLAAAPTIAREQGRPPEPTEQRAALKKLEFIAGKWKGEARQESAPGQWRAITQRETVELKLGGTLLIVEGLGTIRPPESKEDVVVFNAFATISYNAGEKKYTMQSFLMDGRRIEPWIEPVESGFDWGFDAPGDVKIRYRMRLNEKKQWHEVGDYKLPNQEWHRFFEMTLDKVTEKEAEKEAEKSAEKTAATTSRSASPASPRARASATARR
jgi:hypothetical protein